MLRKCWRIKLKLKSSQFAAAAEGPLARTFSGCPEVAQEDEELLLDPGSLSTPYDFSRALRRCGDVRDLATGRLVHARITQDMGTAVQNGVIGMYGKCGDLVSARDVFDSISERNSFSWNIMIAAYAQNGHHPEALEIFRVMLVQGLRPDRVTCIAVLDAFGFVGNLQHQQGRSFHQSVILESGYDSDVIVGTALLTMYNRCGDLTLARETFDSIPVKNFVTWSAMIAAYARGGHPLQALELFIRMDHEGVKPNAITYVSVLDACATLGESKLTIGEGIHDRAAQAGLESDVYLSNTLVHMYGKCGDVERAREVFDRMQTRNTITWNSMMAACSRHELYQEVYELLGKMDLEGLKPSKVTFVSVIDACASMEALPKCRILHKLVADAGLESDYAVGNALVNLYGKCGKLDSASRVLEGIPGRDKISWTTLLAACAQHGKGRTTFQFILRRMDLEGIKPDCFTFVNLIECCIRIVVSSPANWQEQACSLALKLGEEIHERIIDSGIALDSVLQTALVDMYGKCGNPNAAQREFDRMRLRDITVWNALLAAYSLRDQGKEALQVFHSMNLEGLRIDKVTFLGVFEACSSLVALAQARLTHSLLLESGMQSDVLLTTAVINMFAKCGSLEDAKQVFDSSDKVHGPGYNQNHDVVTWSAMVAACSQFGFPEEALRYFYTMQQEGIRPDSVSFVSLLSACSHSGLVGVAIDNFKSLVHDYGVEPSEAHYGCFIDLLSRAGWLHEAERMIKKMPYKPFLSTWMTLLSACRTYGDLKRARRLAMKLAQFKPISGGAYALLASIFSLDRKWDDVKNPKRRLVERGLIKQPGCSWIEIRGRVYEFFVETPVPREEEVFAELERLSVDIRGVGYERDPIEKVHDPGEQEKKFLLCYHSEKLAVVFGLISTQEKTPIRVVKNIGMCRDCHSVIKCISKLTGRVISLRESRGFHQFSEGSCSCADQFS